MNIKRNPDDYDPLFEQRLPYWIEQARLHPPLPSIFEWDCEPEYHPAWANYEYLERHGASPEELAKARIAAEIEGHRQFSMPAINPS